MKIIELRELPVEGQPAGLMKADYFFRKLLEELRTRDLPYPMAEFVNLQVLDINESPSMGMMLAKQIQQKQEFILKRLEKQLKVVPKNHYLNIWMALGLSAFGVPLGMAFGMALGNFSFFAIGIPIGMSIGLAIGSGLDKKAFQEGRQLRVDLKSSIWG
jgi:hypothetical protein